MRPVRSWPFLAVLVASACSVSPRVAEYLVGKYKGPGRPANAEPKGSWIPTRLELCADGSAWWLPAQELAGWASILTLQGCWRVDSPTSGIEVVTVFPRVDDLSNSLSFEVTTVAGQTVLVGEDGSRFTRAH